jgi:hypothetical protein
MIPTRHNLAGGKNGWNTYSTHVKAERRTSAEKELMVVTSFVRTGGDANKAI